MNQEERDLLIRIDQNMSHITDNIQLLRKDFREHILEDKGNFKVLYRFMWGMFGAWGLLVFWLKAFK